MPILRLVQKLHDLFFSGIDRLLGDGFLSTLARFVFAAVLAMYFWSSAMTKLGPGALGFLFLAPGAYAQMLPPVFEAAGLSAANVPIHWKLVALFGTWAEFALPALLIAGLFTRAAALAMIGFVVVQSYVDWRFHDADAETIGAWFDRASGALILDQRAFWIFLLVVIALKGAGPLSLDRLLRRG